MRSFPGRRGATPAVPRVADSTSTIPRGPRCIDVPESLPLVYTDPGLVERSIANVVENAVRYSPADVPVSVTASALGPAVELRVVDRGPGVPDDAKPRMFEPFQRLGDTPAGNGVGLGLAVASGLVEAVGGMLIAEDTPGGGLTMVVSLPTSPPDGGDGGARAEASG